MTMTLDGAAINGVAACNSYGGQYELSANGGFRIRDGLAVTEMACDPPEAMMAEQAFLDAIAAVSRAVIEDDTLVLSGDEVELRFVLGSELPDASGDGQADPDTPVSSDHLIPDGVTGTWQMFAGEVDGVPIPLVDSHPITFTVTEDGFGGSAGCNQYGIVLPLPDDGSFPEIGMTAMLCEDQRVMASENAFSSGLWRVDEIALEDETLVLRGAGVDLRFHALDPVPTADLLGTVWVLDGLALGDSVSSVAGERATIEFFSDGSVLGSTGCREFSGTYVVSGGEVFITSLRMEGECPADLSEQDSTVVSALEGGIRVAIDGDTMTTWTAGDQGLIYRAEG
jgi:heat shock protein HslJ